MSDKNLKQLRGQLRQVVKEVLPELLQEALYKAMLDAMHARINKIENNVKDTLNMVDKRSKDIAGYLVRQSTLPVPNGNDVLTPKE